jgi:hypothetical protein
MLLFVRCTVEAALTSCLTRGLSCTRVCLAALEMHLWIWMLESPGGETAAGKGVWAEPAVAHSAALRLTSSVLRTLPVLRLIRDIDGWFLDDEADLLLAACTRATLDVPGGAVVEVGSYCGRSTIVLASAVAVGAADAGMWSVPPTLERFTANIAHAGVADYVVTVQQRSYEVQWDMPIAFLLVDGLHDRENVERDFRHFEPWLDRNAIVAFHDYSQWYPGVVAFVESLLSDSAYDLVDRAESLALLRPR